jgi:hypothetical protein
VVNLRPTPGSYVGPRQDVYVIDSLDELQPIDPKVLEAARTWTASSEQSRLIGFAAVPALVSYGFVLWAALGIRRTVTREMGAEQ